jgi:hypothetical protein
MRPSQVLSITFRAARAHGLVVREIPGRGKGSHRIFAVFDRAGTEVGRFGVTGHRRELSWTVLRSIERALEPVFGEAWMEDS